MIRSTMRRARKLQRCRCGTVMLPGDDYLELVISPDHGDVGNVGWWRDAECRECALRYDRWPITAGAVHSAVNADRQRAYRDRQRGGPPRELKPCGTRAAIRRHERHGEPLCEACRLERNRLAQMYYQRRKAT